VLVPSILRSVAGINEDVVVPVSRKVSSSGDGAEIAARVLDPKGDRAALMRSLRALPVVVPTEHSWQQVETWIERAARAGDRFGLSDLLVAALADELGGLVWSLDADFERMSALKFVRLYG
jgi:predicted nucleic acid-binding protein